MRCIRSSTRCTVWTRSRAEPQGAQDAAQMKANWAHQTVEAGRTTSARMPIRRTPTTPLTPGFLRPTRPIRAGISGNQLPRQRIHSTRWHPGTITPRTCPLLTIRTTILTTILESSLPSKSTYICCNRTMFNFVCTAYVFFPRYCLSLHWRFSWYLWFHPGII